jgi:streptogramin lyase
MIRWLSLFGLLLCAFGVFGQFPFMRSLEVRPGQQRPAITCVVQDSTGLLWAGSDIGILRTDGELIDVIYRSEGVAVSALSATDGAVLAAINDGRVLRISRDECDTIFYDEELKSSPVRRIAMDHERNIWLATYGSGVWRINGIKILKLGSSMGLPDDHVNDLTVLSNGDLAVATDQGLAIIVNGKVMEVFGEPQGAPDNLVLSLSPTDDGGVWAGTDRGGAFKWRPDTTVQLLDSIWSHGPVLCIASRGDLVWTGTVRSGVVLNDLNYAQASYKQHPTERTTGPIPRELFLDPEGVAWWCEGTDQLHRADPAILFVPDHEGLDLRKITAICTDSKDRIWFATSEGLFHHAAAFSEELQVTHVPLTLDHRTPIVSMTAAADGTIWAATFGSGVLAVGPNDHVTRYTHENGLSNDNVLVVRASGEDIWFATLHGLTVRRNGTFLAVAPDAGFVFDLLPIKNGELLMATDGHGIRRWNGSLTSYGQDGPRTFYSLLQDTQGTLWAAGPRTGICRFDTDTSNCIGVGSLPFEGDFFALGNALGRLIAFGSSGVVSFDPHSTHWTDLTTRLGMGDLQAELNVIAQDASGGLWLGCNKGLVRIKASEELFDPRVTVLITELLINGQRIHGVEGLRTTHDKNDITVRFTGLNYTDPGAVRFEYQANTSGSKVIRTRDREVTFSGLRPGEHVFRFRAFVGEPQADLPWKIITVTVAPPWWKVPWVIALMVLAASLVFVVVLRERDRRIRYRARMEQEKVRFQLEALRSQVDPHFLFNSFNTLVELIETDSNSAVGHVELLSDFFRNILQVRDLELIPLGEELRLLHTYFELERRRFGNSIELICDIPNDAKQQCIVPLTLQLLVENALKHNRITNEERMRITIGSENHTLLISNPDRPRSTPARSTGFGLESIRKRYQALSDLGIRVERTNGSFLVVVPLLTCANEHPDR